jgi:hypothetical protein
MPESPANARTDSVAIAAVIIGFAGFFNKGM